MQKGAYAPFHLQLLLKACASRAGDWLALTRFEARIAFANYENFAATTHNFAVTMAGLSRFERIQNFHDTSVCDL